MRRGLGTSRTTLNIPTSESGVPEGEEEEQKNRLPGSPVCSESSKEVGPKEAHTKAHHQYITEG